jgi:hypothetical protein
MEKHYKNNPNAPWQNGVRLIGSKESKGSKEECLLSVGCLECGESHESILRGSLPDDPCDNEFMKDISS